MPEVGGRVHLWYRARFRCFNPDPAAPGFANVIIRPEVVGDLTSASGSTRTLRGLVHSDWQLAAGTLVMNIEIPVNSSATVFVPAANSTDVVVEGATFVRSEAGRQVFSVGSGKYRFEAR